MPPWLDWLDWLKWDSIGAGVIGKILGLWFRACATVVKGILHPFLSSEPGVRSSAPIQAFELPQKEDSLRHSMVRIATNIVVSTASTLLVWVTLTWKPIWNSVGPHGDRILAAILFLVSAFWIVSLLAICLWRPRQRRVVRSAPFKSS